MEIPIAIRKWLILRWNKQREKENKENRTDTPDINTPLNPQQRAKILAQTPKKSK